MIKRTCSVVGLLCVMLLFGCANTEPQAVLEIPVLRYDSTQGTLSAAHWNLEEQALTAEETVLLQQQDVDAVMRVEWNGDGCLILPKVSSDRPFEKVHTAFFQQVTEKGYENEVLHDNWHCWREDTGTVMLAADNEVYQLAINPAYELAGLTTAGDEVIILLWNPLSGEVALYSYDTKQQAGNLEQVEGFSHLMSSQLWPEQVAIETEQNFYFTDGWEVYLINSQTNQAELVFSKNAFADSFADTELAEALKNCVFRMGFYQKGLLVLLGSSEGVLDKQWLYYQDDERQEILELPIDNAVYLLPNYQN